MGGIRLGDRRLARPLALGCRRRLAPGCRWRALSVAFGLRLGARLAADLPLRLAVALGVGQTRSAHQKKQKTTVRSRTWQLHPQPPRSEPDLCSRKPSKHATKNHRAHPHPSLKKKNADKRIIAECTERRRITHLLLAPSIVDSLPPPPLLRLLPGAPTATPTL